jgi:hypothetical protein
LPRVAAICTETTARPIFVKRAVAEPIIQSFIRDEGAAMAQVALRHLFRVYPEMQVPALKVLNGKAAEVPASTMRILMKYGLINGANRISGEMLRAGLTLIEASPEPTEGKQTAKISENTNSLALALGDWAEELQLIGRRRNLIERRLREIVFNFVKFSTLNDTAAKPAKQRVLDAFTENRRHELLHFTLDQIADKIYWLELAAVVKREWNLFQKIFGDKSLFQENVILINDRPDAHAKTVTWQTWPYIGVH